MCEDDRVTLGVIHESMTELRVTTSNPAPCVRNTIVEAATGRTWRRCGGRYATLDKEPSKTTVVLRLANYAILPEDVLDRIQHALERRGYEVEIKDYGDGVVGLG